LLSPLEITCLYNRILPEEICCPFSGEPPFDQDGDPARLGIGNFPGHPSDLAAGLGPLAGFPTCEPQAAIARNLSFSLFMFFLSF